MQRSSRAGDHLNKTMKLLSKLNGEIANYEDDCRQLAGCSKYSYVSWMAHSMLGYKPYILLPRSVCL